MRVSRVFPSSKEFRVTTQVLHLSINSLRNTDVKLVKLIQRGSRFNTRFYKFYPSKLEFAFRSILSILLIGIIACVFFSNSCSNFNFHGTIEKKEISLQLVEPLSCYPLDRFTTNITYIYIQRSSIVTRFDVIAFHLRNEIPRTATVQPMHSYSRYTRFETTCFDTVSRCFFAFFPPSSLYTAILTRL